MAPSEGTKRGSVTGELGLALGEALGVAVGDGVGGSLAEGETLGVGVGVGFVAEAAVHPVRTRTMALAAPSQAKRDAMESATEKGHGVVHAQKTYHAAFFTPEAANGKMRPRHMTYAQSEDASSIRLALGALLRRRRQEAERSLTELADAADLSPAYLSEVERGLKDVSMERLLAIAKALEVPVADLYLDLARSLGSREAMTQQRSWPDDPRMQLRIATANLRPQALRSVAHFSLYLAATQATPPRRRIGFNLDR
jgi:transcriptional regulator with XRE-family HTH domain